MCHGPTRERWTKENAGSSQSHGTQRPSAGADDLRNIARHSRYAGPGGRTTCMAPCQSHCSALGSMQCDACTQRRSSSSWAKTIAGACARRRAKTARRILEGRRKKNIVMFGGILTNKIRVVSPQLVVQFLRVRLVDGGPEAAAPRDHRVDVLRGSRPGVMWVPGGRVAQQQRSFQAKRTFGSFRSDRFISMGVMSL